MNTTHDPALIDDLVVANHILVNQGVLDGFGHISVRDPAHLQRFFIARSMAPALVQADDILVCDLDSNVIDERGRKTYLERFIHGEIYKLRPDVNAVIHSHSPSVIPFGVTGARLRPICHMSGFLGATTPVYEIRHNAGENSDLLVRNHALGKALAEVLGDHPVALMRGHGSVAVGSSIQQVVYRAIYTENNARLQAMSMPLGEITYLTDGEARATAEMGDQHLDRPWQMWKRDAQQGR
ncbi:MAG: class II aldolase/adducin family protein [Betaproteobacteria bacterium]|nr:class II aldolase/adducin family protein [Betaproteobacteria bacterium]NBY03817.1 class II aldolase/adducin family protein [Betaproteobacteria bacterium]